MRSSFLAPLCALLAVVATPVSAQLHPGPSARDVVEFERIVQPADQNNDLLNEQVSPDGKRAFIVTRKSDVASDKNVYKIQLLDLTPTHLAVQHAPDPVTVFSAAIAQDNRYAYPGIQEAKWHDDRTLVFLARLDGGTFQIYRLDVDKRELVQLTHEKEFIVAWDGSRDLQRLVYTVQVPNPPMHEGEHGVVVGNQSLWAVKYGQDNLKVQNQMYQSFVVDVASSKPPRALGKPLFISGARLSVSVSPDGRWALLPRFESERLPAWARLYPPLGDLVRKHGFSARIDPLHYFSKSKLVPRRMVAYRLDDGREQPVVDAPDDLQAPAGGAREDRLWQGMGRSVVLAGTYLPLNGAGETSPASHVIEYWPDSGRWVDIASLQGQFDSAHPLRDGFFVLDGSGRREFRRESGGGWRETNGAAKGSKQDSKGILRVVQALNQPPDVYASLPSGETTRLTWLNPQFKADTWGSMQPYTWQDGAGREWNGALMAGSDLDMHTRHPLLIQTYGFNPDRFYLDGPNVSDGYSSGFAGRAFLREGLLVLAMPWGPKGGAPRPERRAFEAFYEGVRGAVDALVKDGKVDPARVGIMGWSATGERTLSLLEFGDVPIRSATTADGDTNTLFMYTLDYGWDDDAWQRLEQLNEGAPFGKTLSAWVRNDPALHTDCIHAALRIESYEPVVKPNWDTYALLRRQYKPVEMLVLPDAGHSLLTPGDRMLSLQGNVDWHAFWLAGRTRTTPEAPSETAESLAAQYARWRELEMLKIADDARPSCVR